MSRNGPGKFTRRALIQGSGGTLLAATLAPGLFAQGSDPSFYENGIIIDGLGGPGGLSTDDEAPLSELELKHVRESGLTAVHLTVGAVGSMAPLEAFEKIAMSITHWEGQINAHSDYLSQVRLASDIVNAKKSGETGLIYGLQDGVSFEDDLDRPEALHHLGIRVIQPTYNRRNLLGDGCMEPADAELKAIAAPYETETGNLLRLFREVWGG